MTLSTISPNKLLNILVPLYVSNRRIPTVMLWGPPGVGKSDVVKQMATEVGKRKNKRVHVEDVRLLLFNPIDLRGLPVADASKQFAIWLKPKIFNLDSSPDVINFILLDEITAAPQSVQAAAYQLTLDRKIGEHKLPDNTFVIAAGNRVTDKGVAHKMPTPLANRMTHFEIYPEFEDWKVWAIQNEVNPIVLGFLSFRETYLMQFDAMKEMIAFPTPRSWMFASLYLDIYPNINDAITLLNGTIGDGPTVELVAFAKTHSKLPNLDDILNGKKVNLESNEPSFIYALISAITVRLTKATDQQVKNAVLFIINNTQVEVDFQVKAVRDFSNIQNVRVAIMTLPEWIAWSKKNKVFFLN